MIYVVKINDKEYEVEVEKGKANLLKTTTITAAPVAPVAAAPAAAAPIAAAPAAALAAGATPVNAPMPGTILNVRVTAGQSVKAGEILVILEAMKMENEIVAPKDGVIAQVAVTKGATVDTGALLVSIS
ncbi:MAG TPA: biotin/lipoyl-binding protein [Bacillota bacterium]|nr:biotin/lipoyl-binding protein [Bacillota bacterium]HPE38075.1 biotin/lipoyl-binding protein [Bacillota bacterium]